MDRFQAMVLEFHKAMGLAWRTKPTKDVPFEEADLRIDLMREEFYETQDAIIEEDMEGIADGLADLLYVVYGTAVAYGIDMAPVFCEVHKANMRKIGGPVREDGKRLKPEGWQPPRITEILAVLAERSIG